MQGLSLSYASRQITFLYIWNFRLLSKWSHISESQSQRASTQHTFQKTVLFSYSRTSLFNMRQQTLRTIKWLQEPILSIKTLIIPMWYHDHAKSTVFLGCVNNTKQLALCSINQCDKNITKIQAWNNLTIY